MYNVLYMFIFFHTTFRQAAAEANFFGDPVERLVSHDNLLQLIHCLPSRVETEEIAELQGT